VDKLGLDILVHSPESAAARGRFGTAFFRGRAANRRAAHPCLRSVSLRRMAIVNKRNAFVGFLVLKVGKIVARKKAKKLTRKLPFGSKR